MPVYAGYQQNCKTQLKELKEKLSWLRYFVLSGEVQKEDPLLPLKKIAFRHQQDGVFSPSTHTRRTQDT
jgi:hypothetical protein